MIGGNTTAVLQVRTVTKNEYGTQQETWHDVMDLEGWIDYLSGEARIGSYNAKIQESTHIFIGDYKPVPATLEIKGKTVRVNDENTRMVANSQRYDVRFIDNPMNLNKQLEIYLKFTGGQ